MDEVYKVPYEEGKSEYTEKRSRFLGHVRRVESEAEAKAFIEEIRKRHYDARHNCFCYILKEGNVVRYGDDGEPQGTAGQPMLHVFQMQEVYNVCCVVTRYFGGILLGAGGLTRAYAKSAADALAAAGISRMDLFAEVLTVSTYSLYERIRQLTEEYGGTVTSAEFTQDVLLTVRLPAATTSSYCKAVAELSAGTVETREVGRFFCPGPREEIK